MLTVGCIIKHRVTKISSEWRQVCGVNLPHCGSGCLSRRGFQVVPGVMTYRKQLWILLSLTLLFLHFLTLNSINWLSVACSIMLPLASKSCTTIRDKIRRSLVYLLLQSVSKLEALMQNYWEIPPRSLWIDVALYSHYPKICKECAAD